MGCCQSVRFRDTQTLRKLTSETGFTENQIHRFYDRFLTLDRGQKGYLNSDDLLALDDLLLNPMGDRIILAMYREDQSANLSHGKEVMIRFENFVRCLARFRPLDPNNKYCSVEGKLQFFFRLLYISDHNNEEVSASEIFDLLKTLMSLSNRDASEEDIQEFCQLIPEEAGGKENGNLTFRQFVSNPENQALVSRLFFRFFD